MAHALRKSQWQHCIQRQQIEVSGGFDFSNFDNYWKGSGFIALLG
jgi:hypothetical protein